jgi:DNA-binding MarR family transcriptional regulator
MAASRLFMAISARALGDIDPALTLVQLRTLVVLDSQGPVKLAALAATLGVNPSSAMRMVDKLEAQALADRQVNPGNRREVLVRLTEEGRSLVGEVLARRHEQISALVARLPTGQRTHLIEALRALVEAAGEAAVSAPGVPIVHVLSQ